ncbi:hypothetical protein O3P69_004930 [Scylla paramamosain]|uniref:C-factor n=1 Tax=Scylla paramamosain TaxID=85552 RepID=A0AAW0UA47_SCYPA
MRSEASDANKKTIFDVRNISESGVTCLTTASDSFHKHTHETEMSALLPILKIAATQAEGSGLSVKRAAIINISSVLGSIEKNDKEGIYPYRASKAALNAITKSLSTDLRSSNIFVSSICPGWAQTDMGGKNASLTPEQSISNVLHLLNTMNDTHHGQFYQHDGYKMPW